MAAKKRKTKPKTDAQKILTKQRKDADKHVLVLETDLAHNEMCRFFALADRERKAGNELVAIMQTNLTQLLRTKCYRRLKKLYGKYKGKDKKTTEKRIHICNQMQAMQEAYQVTWDVCRKTMEPIGKKHNVPSIFALTKAEDVWKGVEKVLFGNGKRLHFAKRDDLPGIRAKQSNRGISIANKNDHLQLTFDKLRFGVIIKDQFERDELRAMLAYLKQPEYFDALAVAAHLNKTKVSTFRPCYVTLVCKTIRGRMRIYVHITLEGLALPKVNKDGTRKHHYGTGIIGCDIGTQTIAYTSDSCVGLKNLAERGRLIMENERQQRLINRKLDRSRRATNPDNYNANGTIKKGKKTWEQSNRYKKLRVKYKDLCRINAENRYLAINEEVNALRALGDIFVTEPKNAERLKRRAKKTTVNKNGKFNKKARYGKSVGNRCPGYFQAQIERKFLATGGHYYEVPNDYRASQYDHTVDDYIKKTLSQRIYKLGDGTSVQRDCYSSFLLHCVDIQSLTIDKKQCVSKFSTYHQRQQDLIAFIKLNQFKILNSGIKVA